MLPRMAFGPFWFSLIVGHGIHLYLLSDGGEVPEVRPQMLGG